MTVANLIGLLKEQNPESIVVTPINALDYDSIRQVRALTLRHHSERVNWCGDYTSAEPLGDVEVTPIEVISIE